MCFYCNDSCHLYSFISSYRYCKRIGKKERIKNRRQAEEGIREEVDNLQVNVILLDARKVNTSNTFSLFHFVTDSYSYFTWIYLSCLTFLDLLFSFFHYITISDLFGRNVFNCQDNKHRRGFHFFFSCPFLFFCTGESAVCNVCVCV